MAALGEPPARVLDVGCGGGHLTAALTQKGFEVTGIEPDAEAVSVARQNNLDVREVGFLDFADELGFDAILFARSLHHITPLEAAVDRARDLLRAGGCVVLDEFAHDQADPAGASLFYNLRAVLAAAGLAHELHEHTRPQEDPLARWRVDHEHDPPLHSGRAMVQCLGQAFPNLDVEYTPYFWAYLSDGLIESPAAAQAVTALRSLEEGLVAQGAITPVGLRVLAR